jgi:prophage regulatory protein
MNLNQPYPQSKAQQFEQRILRLPAVLLTTGLTCSTMYRLIAEGKFPAPVKLAKRAVGWQHNDVWKWTNDRPTAPR